jgi:hypothetical protein
VDNVYQIGFGGLFEEDLLALCSVRHSSGQKTHDQEETGMELIRGVEPLTVAAI